MIFNRKIFCIVICTLICSILSGCLKKDEVTIQNRGSHYYLTVDYTSGKSHYEIGKLIGEAYLKGVDDFEKRYDDFISLTAENYGFPEPPQGTAQEHYALFMKRVSDLKPLITPEIRDEIEGVADCLSGGADDIMGDGKLSKNEYYFVNLMVESSENSECCAVSAFSSASKNGKNIIGRVMDWYIDTEKKDAEHLFSITEYRHEGFKLYSVGIVGHLGIITGIRSNGVYSALFFSRNNSPFIGQGKYSFSMELRNAMEKYPNIDDMAQHMKSKDRNYTMNHNLLFSDKDRSIVLENDVQGGPGARREIRTWDSKLNPGVEWRFKDRLAVVNSFILAGNDDNHTKISGNQNRWLSILRLMKEKKSPLSPKDMRSIITYSPSAIPDDFDKGGLYTKWSKQIMIFQPGDMSLEIFFSPKNSGLPEKPVFEKIELK